MESWSKIRADGITFAAALHERWQWRLQQTVYKRRSQKNSQSTSSDSVLINYFNNQLAATAMARESEQWCQKQKVLCSQLGEWQRQKNVTIYLRQYWWKQSDSNSNGNGDHGLVAICAADNDRMVMATAMWCKGTKCSRFFKSLQKQKIKFYRNLLFPLTLFLLFYCSIPHSILWYIWYLHTDVSDPGTYPL